MRTKFIIFLLMVSLYGIWLEIFLLIIPLTNKLDPLSGYLLVTCLTALTIILVKILFDFIYALKNIYQKKYIFTIFPFLIIKKQKINVRFSPYFSFHRKYLDNSSLKYNVISIFLCVIVLIATIILNEAILSIAFTTMLFLNIMEINHLSFNPIEIMFNDSKWKKEDSFESSLNKTLKNHLQNSKLTYSNLMCILLYDAINQCTFLTDSDIFGDIFAEILNSENIVLCTGLVELLMYEISISKNNNCPEKCDKIRKQLITIDQLDFFCYTSWLRYNFDLCINREYDKLEVRKILISNRTII